MYDSMITRPQGHKIRKRLKRDAAATNKTALHLIKLARRAWYLALKRQMDSALVQGDFFGNIPLRIVRVSRTACTRVAGLQPPLHDDPFNYSNQTYGNSSKGLDEGMLLSSWTLGRETALPVAQYEAIDARNFIRAHFPDDVLRAYDALLSRVPTVGLGVGAGAADVTDVGGSDEEFARGAGALFLLCELFVHGGIAVSAGCERLVAYEALLKANGAVIVDEDGGGLCSEFFAARAGAPWLAAAIVDVVNGIAKTCGRFVDASDVAVFTSVAHSMGRAMRRWIAWPSDSQSCTFLLRTDCLAKRGIMPLRARLTQALALPTSVMCPTLRFPALLIHAQSVSTGFPTQFPTGFDPVSQSLIAFNSACRDQDSASASALASTSKLQMTLREWQAVDKAAMLQDIVVQNSSADGLDKWLGAILGVSTSFGRLTRDEQRKALGAHGTDRPGTLLHSFGDQTDTRRRHLPLNRSSIKATLTRAGFLPEQLDARVYFLDALPRHKFVASPEGQGIDCHRHCEALLAGCVVVAEDNPRIRALYATLPVLWTRDFSELSRASLDAVYTDMLDTEYDFAPLFLSAYSRAEQHAIKARSNWWCAAENGARFYDDALVSASALPLSAHGPVPGSDPSAVLAQVQAKERPYRPPPKILWTHWDALPLPPLLEKTLARMRVKHADWDVRFLTTATFVDHVHAMSFSSSSSAGTLLDTKTPPLPPTFLSLSPTHQSDYIRLWLLAVHGGLWADLSIVFNESATRFYDACVAERAELGGFYSIAHTLDAAKAGAMSAHDAELAANPARWKHAFDVDAHGMHVPVHFPSVENFFLLAPRHAPLVEAWLDEYTYALRIGVEEYGRIVAAQCINSFAHDTPYYAAYQALHAVFQAVLHKQPQKLEQDSRSQDSRHRLYFEPVEDSMYKVPTTCSNNFACVAAVYRSPAARSVPYIKLTSGDRAHFPLSYFD